MKKELDENPDFIAWKEQVLKSAETNGVDIKIINEQLFHYLFLLEQSPREALKTIINTLIRVYSISLDHLSRIKEIQ